MLNEDEQDIYNQLAKLLVDRKKIKGKEYHYQEGEKFYVCLDDQPEKQKNDLDIYRMDCLWVDSVPVRIELQIKSLTNYFGVKLNILCSIRIMIIQLVMIFMQG